MAESTLTQTYTDLLQSVGHLLGYGRDSTAYSTNQTADCDAAVQKGYRWFLHPASIPVGKDQSPIVHDWSFLTPIATLSLTADDYDIDLLAVGAQQVLFRNNGDGSFLDVSKSFPFVKNSPALAAASLELWENNSNNIVQFH